MKPIQTPCGEAGAAYGKELHEQLSVFAEEEGHLIAYLRRRLAPG